MSDFLAAYDATAPADRDALILQWIGTRSDALFAELQRHQPILIGPRQFAVVTRHADCVEVLSRPTAFSVAPYGRKMAEVGLPVMLGEDDSARYERDHAAMRLVIRRDDLPELRTSARARAARLLAGATGEIEVAALTRRLVSMFLIDYFGLGAVAVSDLQHWAREIFRGVFLEVGTPASPVLKAAAAAFGAHVDSEIAEGRRVAPSADTVLDRLLTLRCGADASLPDEAIRTNLVGLTAGAIETVTDAVACTLDALFDFPDALAGARAAAAVDDTAALLAYCEEAVRLRPPLALLVRRCERDTVIAEGTPRAATIPKGHLVFAALAAAGIDPSAVPLPDAFQLGRPADLGTMFGVGPHACFGRRIGELLIVEQVRALLRLPGLARAPGVRGRIVRDLQSNAFVDSFYLVAGSTLVAV